MNKVDKYIKIVDETIERIKVKDLPLSLFISQLKNLEKRYDDIIVNSSNNEIYFKRVIQNPDYDPAYISLKQKAEEMGYELKEKPPVKVKFSRCDGCGYQIDEYSNKGHKDGCNWVWGRRGWRQLGVYDG